MRCRAWPMRRPFTAAHCTSTSHTLSGSRGGRGWSRLARGSRAKVLASRVEPRTGKPEGRWQEAAHCSGGCTGREGASMSGRCLGEAEPVRVSHLQDTGRNQNQLGATEGPQQCQVLADAQLPGGVRPRERQHSCKVLSWLELRLERLEVTCEKTV